MSGNVARVGSVWPNMQPPIDARFDLVTRLTDMSGATIHRCGLWQVPDVGQIVSIEGNPYRVISIGWALPSMAESDPDDAVQYAYVKVQKASDF